MKPVRVDFYLLQEGKPEALNLLACRLLEKAYLRRHTIFVYCADEKKALHLDTLLWVFKAESFIPHQLQNDEEPLPCPILIGCNNPPDTFHDVLLNLSDEVPSFYSQFKRVIELVPNSEVAKEISRAHYRIYRKEGCELHSHSIDTREAR